MRKYVSLFKETFKEFMEDKAPRLGAALAYYTIFSIGPLILISIAMAGVFLGDEAAQGRVSAELDKVFGSATSESVEEIVKAAAKPKTGTLATIIGIVTLLFGASGVFGQLKDALNTIWNVKSEKPKGIRGFVKARFLSMAMVLGIGFLLLVTLMFDTAISAMGDYLGQYVGGEAVLQSLQLIVSFMLVTFLFAAIFRILPDLRIEWRDVWLGAAFTALFFVLGKFALGLYLGKAAVGSSYGAAGSLVILLIWVYWSSQILFFGAEFTQVYARTRGSLQGDTSKKKAVEVAERPEDRPRVEPQDSGSAPGPRPASHPSGPVPAYGKVAARSGGGAIKVAAGGVAGLLLGAIAGVVTLVVVVLKSAKKLVTSFK